MVGDQLDRLLRRSFGGRDNSLVDEVLQDGDHDLGVDDVDVLEKGFEALDVGAPHYVVGLDTGKVLHFIMTINIGTTN
jgi:hypothetical protein